MQPPNRFDIPVSSLMSNITMHVHITGMSTFKARIWIAQRLIGLAGRVLGCGVEVTSSISNH